MHVRTDGHRALFVSRVYQPEEPFGGIRADGQQSNVVDDDKPRAENGLHSPGDRIVGTMATHQYTQFLEAEPGHFETGLNGQLAKPLQEKRFSGPRRATHNQVLVAADPLECAQRTLGRRGNRG